MEPNISMPKPKKIKIYTALLSQNGTNAPIATVLQNTLGEIEWLYDSEGFYTANLADAFPVDKTFCIISSTSGGLTEIANNEVGEPSSQIYVRTPNNDNLYLTSVEIRVYNL